MRKYLLLFISITVILINPSRVFASTNTYERTSENNYGITKGYDISNNLNYIETTPLIDASEKIYDFADLYTDEQEAELYNVINSYITEHQIDIAIVTIDNNPKTYTYFSTQDYADDFYDYNDFGYGDDYSGILFLIDMENRIFYISTSGCMMSIVNDNRVEKILTLLDNDMSLGNYYDATLTFINQAKKYINYHEHGPVWLWVGMCVLALIVAIILIKNELKEYKLIKREERASIYLSDDFIEEKEDTLIGHSSYFIPNRSDSGVGRGSSGHHSSSGSSHGGGGHHF